MTVPTSTWRTRILRTGAVDPSELVANPANWRQHPRHQHDALRDLLGQVGWVQGVVINETTGNLVDGHLRAELAVADRAPAIPATWVELTEEEERLVLAALDPVGDLAVADTGALEALLSSLDVQGPGLRGMLDDLIASNSTAVDLSTAEMPGEQDFWPYVRFQVSHDTLAAWEAWWATLPGATDDDKARALLDA
jgi:hypothetical protein